MKRQAFILILAFNLFYSEAFAVQDLYSNNYGILPSVRSIVNTDKTFFAVMSDWVSNSGNVTGMIYPMKTDSMGNVIWSQEIVVPNLSYFQVMDLIQAQDGGFFILFDNNFFSRQEAFHNVIKLSSSGNFLWTKSYRASLHNISTSIIKNLDNGFMITGGGCDGNEYVIKCDANGSIVWQNQYCPGVGGVAACIATHDYDKFVITGYDGFNISFFQIDVLGNLYWYTEIPFVNDGVTAFAMKPAMDGGYIATGQVYFVGQVNHAFVIKIDSLGMAEWFNIYSPNGNEAEGFDLVELVDSSIIVVGAAYDPPKSGFLLKLDKDGNLQFSYSEIGYYSTYESINNYSSSEVIISGERDISLIARADTGLKSLCNYYPLQLQETTPIYTQTYPHCTPTILTMVEDILPMSIQNFFLQKATMCGTTAINENNFDRAENLISPNPFNNVTQIQLQYPVKNASLIVYDIVGKKCKEINELSGQSFAFQRDDLESGVYLFNLIEYGKVVISQKVMIADK